VEKLAASRRARTRLAVVDVRFESAHDQADVRRVHLDGFGDHGEAVANLVDDLRTGDELSLVAEEEGAIVGHTMFTPSLLDAPRRIVAVRVLSPVGVLRRRQKHGVGSALIRRGLEILAERGVPVVFVEGPPKYYSRFGFEPGAELGFRKPSLRIPDDAFQALRLAAYEPWMTGTLVYPETFWRHDAVGLRDRGLREAQPQRGRPDDPAARRRA
jgi:putative acetyltransferase